MKIEFYDKTTIPDNMLTYVVLPARIGNNWIFVRHEERTTWEIPGGHIEEGELPDDAAKRELVEETGAVTFEVRAVCDYSVERNDQKSYGRLYICDVSKLGVLGVSEIVEVIQQPTLPEKLTYPEIQPVLLKEVIRRTEG